MNNFWEITRKSFEVQKNLSDEGLFTQGSGYFHVRASLEENLQDDPQNISYMRIPGNVTVEKRMDSKSKWGTYIPGIFARHPLLNNEMVNLPYFLGLSLEVDKEIFNPETSDYSSYQRTLKIKTSEIIRTFKWKTKSGAAVSVKFERFASSARKHLFLQRLTLSADSPVDLKLTSTIDADVRTSGFDHLKETIFENRDDKIICNVTTDSGIKVIIASYLKSNKQLFSEFFDHQRKAYFENYISLSENETLIIEKRTSISSSHDLIFESKKHLSLSERSGKYLIEVNSKSYDELLNEHIKNISERWNNCDIKIEGDEKSQMAMRISLYHLLRTHVPDDSRVTIDAKGYAGDAYFGRFFWDTEMYMLPFYLYTDLERAKNFTDFRIQSLSGAVKNAQRYGYKGAKYPWESDSEGNEGCPLGNWQYSDHELHVTGAVAYGLAHYAKAAENENYLKNEAKKVLLETARYWIDRTDWRKGENYPSLLGVMGPDEYTPLSSNNAYTNQIAKFSLKLACKYADCTEEEREIFRKTAELLPVLKKDKLVLQCEEFESLAEPEFDKTWKERSKPYGANVHQEKLYRTKCLKQADVLMLMYLFPDLYSEDEIKAAWNYYVPYCTHDSSLSGGIHSILASRLGFEKEAFEFWNDCSCIDLDDGAAQGIHIANCASNWMVAVFGFSGVKSVMDSEHFCLNPGLPEKWNSISFPIIWKGQKLFININKKEIKIDNKSSKDIKIEVRGKELIVKANNILAIKY